MFSNDYLFPSKRLDGLQMVSILRAEYNESIDLCILEIAFTLVAAKCVFKHEVLVLNCTYELLRKQAGK